MSSVEEIKAKIKRFCEEPWNTGDFSIVDEFCDPAYRVGWIDGTEITDREGLKQHIKKDRAESPDFHSEVGEIIVEGERAAYSWQMRCTLKGERVVYNGITFLHLAAGKIIQDRCLFVETRPK